MSSLHPAQLAVPPEKRGLPWRKWLATMRKEHWHRFIGQVEELKPDASGKPKFKGRA